MYLSVGNLLWTLVFGWWLALICLLIGIVLVFVPFGGSNYGQVVLGLSYYLLWPFGQYVERELNPGEIGASGLHGANASDVSGHGYRGQSNSHGQRNDSSNGNGYGVGSGNGRLSYISPSEESRPLLPRSSSTYERERERQRIPLSTTVKNIPRTLHQLGLGGIVYYGFYFTIIGMHP